MSYASFQSRCERQRCFRVVELAHRLLGDVQHNDSRAFLDIAATHPLQGWAALCFLKVRYLTLSSRTGTRCSTES